MENSQGACEVLHQRNASRSAVVLGSILKNNYKRTVPYFLKKKETRKKKEQTKTRQAHVWKVATFEIFGTFSGREMCENRQKPVLAVCDVAIEKHQRLSGAGLFFSLPGTRGPLRGLCSFRCWLPGGAWLPTYIPPSSTLMGLILRVFHYVCAFFFFLLSLGLEDFLFFIFFAQSISRRRMVVNGSPLTELAGTNLVRHSIVSMLLSFRES